MPEGTGVLLQVADRRFVLTAAHVLKLWKELALIIPTGERNGINLTACLAEVACDEHEADFALIPLSPEMVDALLPAKDFVRLAETDVTGDEPPLGIHAVLGYPQEMAKRGSDNLTSLAIRRYDQIVGEVDEQGFFRSAYDGFFRALSATPETMMNWSRDRLRDLDPAVDELRVRFDGPNPLARYPLVRCYPDKSDYCIAPVPHLIQEWLYEPLMDLLAREVGTGTGLGQNVGAALFEEYIGLLADRCSPMGAGWIHESGLQPTRQGRKVVDWARPLGGHIVLLDAKRSYVEPSARGRWDPGDWTSIKNAITKGVKQACSFWSAVKAGEVPALRGMAPATPVALIVTQGDSTFYNSTETWRAEVDAAVAVLPDVVPWTVASLDVYEKVMSTWRSEDENWLPTILMKTAQERSHKAFADLPLRAEGPLWEAQSAFLHQHVARTDPVLAERLAAQDHDGDENDDR